MNKKIVKSKTATRTASAAPASAGKPKLEVGAFVLIEVESASGIIILYGGQVESMTGKSVVTSCCSAAKVSSVKEICADEKEFKAKLNEWIMNTPKKYPAVRGARSWDRSNLAAPSK